MKRTHILIIDDEPQIQKLLKLTLEAHNYEVTIASSSHEGMIDATTKHPDLIVLDLGLPDESGHKTLYKLRTWYKKPVIILSVINAEKDIITALDVGANDYIIKPFRTGELLARVRLALRQQDADQNTAEIFKFRNVEIDFENYTVKRNGEIVKLTSTQFALLDLFVRNEGKVLTYSYMLERVWGPTYKSQVQYLRVFVAQLRKKIEEFPEKPKLIRTESGIGYRFISSN